MSPMSEARQSTANQPDDTDDLAWQPAAIAACYECGVFFEAGEAVNYCTRCGEELWELTKA